MGSERNYIMQCAVKKFAESKESGLCLIDMPTGTGKTYQTGKIIEKYIRGEILQNVETVIYLTPLKKNINDIFDDIQGWFKDNPELFNNSVLRLFPNYECVLENLLEEEVDSKIPDNIKKKESYKSLRLKVLEYKKDEADGNYPKDLLNQALKDIRVSYEPKFRRDLELEINKLAKTKPEKKKLILHDFSWVKVLYPSCLSGDRKVLFMTMDKFLSINDPIIEKPYTFLSRLKSKSSLVFIDEFDATKDVILNQEIERCTDYKIDLARLFSTITSALKGRELPTQLFAGSPLSQESFKKMKEVMLKTEQQYDLNYIFKLDSVDNSDRYFLFDDYQIHTISATEKGSFVNVKNDKGRNQNVITFDDRNDNGSFYRAIYAIKNAINYFIRCCAMMSRNYMNKKNEEAAKKGEDFMEVEQAVSSVIDFYNLDRELESIITELIIADIALPAASRKRDIMDTDFYMNGFRYYDFSDDMSHDASTAIMMCYLNNTPEKFILSLADRARIVGLSATASIKSVTGNYNLDYIQTKLGDKFYTLSNEDIKRITDYVRDALSGDYTITAQPLSVETGEAEVLAKQLFDNEENIELFTDEFERHQDSESKNPFYDVARTLKAMLAVKQFLKNDKSKVLLVLTNKNVKYVDEGDPYSQSLIEKVIASLSKEIKPKSETPKIHYLFGNEFEREKQKYYEEVAAGKKIILFSSYPAVGTGQNLQYEENVGDEELKAKRDIDSIYIELPTNIIVHNKSIKEEGNLNKYIYQMETLRANGEIDPFSSEGNIKLAFKQFMNPNVSIYFNPIPYKCTSTNNHIVKTLVQAVGRICRTKKKDERHQVNIYIDDEIMRRVDFTFMKNRLMNPEFQKIIELSNVKPEFDVATIIALNKAIECNIRVEARLNQILSDNRTIWSEEDRRQWKLIRETVLKYPTISREKVNELVKVPGLESIKDFYVFQNEGRKIAYYMFNKDATKNPILFGSNPEPGYIKLDADGSRLRLLLNEYSVRKHFEKNGFAQYFNADDGMILPVIYQNIYKGALGEEAGKAILESWGFRLAEIDDPEKFEKFDFCLERNKDVYIDFKNWSERDREDRVIKKMSSYEKLEKIGGKKAFIINMIAEEFNIHDSDGIVEVSTLYKCKRGAVYGPGFSIKSDVCKKLKEAERYGN